jgi:hypothetical protein
VAEGTEVDSLVNTPLPTDTGGFNFKNHRVLVINAERPNCSRNCFITHLMDALSQNTITNIAKKCEQGGYEVKPVDAVVNMQPDMRLRMLLRLKGLLPEKVPCTRVLTQVKPLTLSFAYVPPAQTNTESKLSK